MTVPARVKKIIHYDPYLVVTSAVILGLGLLMLASSSIVIAERAHDFSFYYLIRQSVFLLAGIVLAAAATRIHLIFWKKISGYLLLFSFILLVLVLIPGIGHEVNGSMRWISLGTFSFQVSEIVKLGVVTYMAGYLVRRQAEVQTRMRGFIKPVLVLALVTFMLLQEPDFGAAVVIIATVFFMLFLAGVPLWQFALLILLAAAALSILAISEPYRLLRLTTFLHPWENPFDTGYQLTQSLIAFGRGGIFGVGLGNSVQKLFYLPEAHTDFLFAVLGEELGLMGQLCVMGLFVVLIGRVMLISYRAYHNGHLFGAFLGWGLGWCIGLQAFINIGVNLGILPTKGLTLPLMSYGGSSLLLNCLALGILVRIAYESRYKNIDLPSIDRTPMIRRGRIS